MSVYPIGAIDQRQANVLQRNLNIMVKTEHTELTVVSMSQFLQAMQLSFLNLEA
jgi:hypothetical protein